MDSKEEEQKPVEPEKEEKLTIWNVLLYAVIGALASLVFYVINFRTSQLTPNIIAIYRVSNPQIRSYEDSIYRINPKTESRLYSQIFGFVLSFVIVFGALYLFARDKLNVWEILGFSIVSILLGSFFFSKYFLKMTANVFPGEKNPFPTYYLEGSEKEVASANAVLFGVPVGVFLTNVAVLFGLFYGYATITNKF